MDSFGVSKDGCFSSKEKRITIETRAKAPATVHNRASALPSQQGSPEKASFPVQRHLALKQVYKARANPSRTSKNKSLPKPSKTKVQEKNKLWRRLVSDVLFFAALLGIVLGAGIYKQTYQQGSSILGHYFFTVLTTSMQSEIPKGSLVVVKTTPAAELQVGDDITFYRDPKTIVTHRIIGIEENYENSGGRGFITKGTENPMQDEDPVHEANVMGRVIKTIPNFGFAISLIGANLKWIILLLALLFVLITSLRILFFPKSLPKVQPPESTQLTAGCP